MSRKNLSWKEGLSPQEKEALVQKIAAEARYNELHYYGCSQSVLGALQKHLGIGSDGLFKAATPFFGGATMGELCGAVSGGMLAIGSVYGREQFQDGVNAHNDPQCAESRRRARFFLHKFRDEYGYLTCRDIRYQVRGIPTFAQLLPPDPTPEDWARADALYPNHDKCGDVCAKAAKLAAEVILAPQIVLE
ncbi:C-GCAxxG-C-C family protein [Chloroflexota bacterium]